MSFSLVGIVALMAKSTTQKKTIEESSGSTNSMGVMGLLTSDSIIEDIIRLVPEKKTMRYFKPEEFGGWYDKMSPELLKKLDEFRHQWGFPVMVSPHEDAVGRDHGSPTSQHNVLTWGEVRAVDVFPKNSLGGFINSAAERKRAYDIARRVGFTGIGLYTDTVPGNMLHVDVRQAPLAKWSRVAGNFGAIEKVLV